MFESSLHAGERLLFSEGGETSTTAAADSQILCSREQLKDVCTEEGASPPRAPGRRARAKTCLRLAAAQRVSLAVAAAAEGEETRTSRPRRKATPSLKRLQALQDKALCHPPPADASRPSAPTPTTTANSIADGEQLVSEQELASSLTERRGLGALPEPCEEGLAEAVGLDRPEGRRSEEAACSSPSSSAAGRRRLLALENTSHPSTLCNSSAEEPATSSALAKDEAWQQSPASAEDKRSATGDTIESFADLVDLVRDLPPKKAQEAQALVEGLVVPDPPYGPVIVEVWKVQLGEAGRGDLKREISERVARCPVLKPAVNAVSKLKTATVEQLVVISEIVGLLKKALLIAQRYERERLNCFLGSRRQPRLRLSGSFLAELSSPLTPAQDVELFDRCLRARPKRRLIGSDVQGLLGQGTSFCVPHALEETPSSSVSLCTPKGLVPKGACAPAQPASAGAGSFFSEQSGALLESLCKLFPQTHASTPAQRLSPAKRTLASGAARRSSLPLGKRSRSTREAFDEAASEERLATPLPQTASEGPDKINTAEGALSEAATRLSALLLQNLSSETGPSAKLLASLAKTAAQPEEGAAPPASETASSQLEGDALLRRRLFSCVGEGGGAEAQGRTREGGPGSLEGDEKGLDDATLLFCLLKMASAKGDFDEKSFLQSALASAGGQRGEAEDLHQHVDSCASSRKEKTAATDCCPERRMKEGAENAADVLLSSRRFREDAEAESLATPVSVLGLLMQNHRLRLELKEQQRQTEVFARGLFCLFKELLVQMLSELTQTVSNFFHEQLGDQTKDALRGAAASPGEPVVSVHSAKPSEEKDCVDSTSAKAPQDASPAPEPLEEAAALGEEEGCSRPSAVRTEGTGEGLSQTHEPGIEGDSPAVVSSEIATGASEL